MAERVQTLEERIKEMEEEKQGLEKLIEGQKKFLQYKEYGEELTMFLEGLQAGGLSREEAFRIMMSFAHASYGVDSFYPKRTC